LNITGRARTGVDAPRFKVDNAPFGLDKTIHIWHTFLLEEGIDSFEMGNTTTMCLWIGLSYLILGIAYLFSIIPKLKVRSHAILRHRNNAHRFSGNIS